MEIQQTIALVVFIGAYVVISTDIFHKTIAVLLGATFFVIAGFFLPEGKKIIEDQHQMFSLIDWNVIFLLLSMMIIVGIVKKTGFSQFLAIKAAKLVKGDPVKILVLFAIMSAVFSAILGTVTTVLLLVPVSILIAVELDVTPLPFVMVEAMAANIGGCATLVGDATTIMVGSAFKLDFLDYMLKVTPILGVILVVFSILIVFLFRKKLRVTNERKARIMEFDESKSIQDYPLLIKSLVVVAFVITGFMLHNVLHLEVATIALFGAATLMLLAGGKEVDHFFAEVEWGTIFFFIGLFVLVGGVVETGLIKILGGYIVQVTGGDIVITSILMVWASGIISALVDNVPYVATMIPLTQEILSNMGAAITDPIAVPLWLSLLLGADLGGNGTLVGATANVVSVGLASKSGYKITFMDFTKYGALITVVNLIIVSVMIYFIHLLPFIKH